MDKVYDLNDSKKDVNIHSLCVSTI